MIFKKVNSSIFYKALIIISIAFIFIVYSTKIAFIKTQNLTHLNKMRENSVNFAKMIIDQIESPVNKDKAIFIAKRLDVAIYIKTLNAEWSYPENMEPIDVNRLAEFNDVNTRTGFLDGELQVYIKNGDIEYIINLEPNMRKYSTIYRSFTKINLFFSALSLLFIYIALRWLLNPIKKLHKAIKLVSTGDFKFSLKTKRIDELGDLINSFREMKGKIDYMVKARERLLLDVSHELRSPITRIKLSLEMMSEVEEKSDIYSDISEIETMVNVLLDNSLLNRGQTALKMSNIEIISLIKEVFSKSKEQSIKLNLTAFAEEIFLIADPKWLKIMFRNIISNAIKFSSQESDFIDVSIKKNNLEIIISITNYGVGISKSDLEKVFEPFYRVEKSRCKDIEGYGLGLGICKKIVFAHKGQIRIKSDMETKTTAVEVSLINPTTAS